MELDPGINKSEEGCRSGTCQHLRSHLEHAPPNGYDYCQCPQGERLLPFVSPGGSPRSVSGSDPEILANCCHLPGPRAPEILCAAFNVEFLFPTAISESKSCWPSKTHILTVHLPSAGTEARGLDVGLILCTLRRISAMVIILALMGHLPRGMGC